VEFNMPQIRGGRLATTFAATILLSGAFLSLPSVSARAASLIDIAPATADSAVPPVEMQRRGGGFRGGSPGFRGPVRGGRPGFRGGRGGGNVGAAIGLGAAALIIGGAAAAAASQRDRECWIERRWVEGPYGPERRRVRVCE
jgi:hypothetical protein